MATVLHGIGPLSSRTLYADPKTLLESMIECCEFIDKARNDPLNTKEHVLDSMEMRMSFLIGKMVASPTCMPYKLFTEDT